MRKYSWVIGIILVIVSSQLQAQELYQEGLGTHIDQLNFNINHSHGSLYSVNVSTTVRHRLNKRLDLGLMISYHHINEVSIVATDGNTIALGPVLGYMLPLSDTGWGLRSTLGLRFTLSDIAGYGNQGKMALAGYGADWFISLFKYFNITQTVKIYPGIGFFALASHLTGDRRDQHSISNFWGIHILENELPEQNNFVNTGIFINIPVSLPVFNNKRLVIEPYFIQNFKATDLGTDNKIGILLRFSF